MPGFMKPVIPHISRVYLSARPGFGQILFPMLNLPHFLLWRILQYGPVQKVWFFPLLQDIQAVARFD